MQKHATLTNHGFLGYAVIIGKTFWEKLPPDLQAVIRRAMDETTPIANALAAAENADSMIEMEKSGKTVFYKPTDEERAAWERALAPVHRAMSKRVGQELIERIYAATGRTPREAGAAP